eukprot:TRINITY_DN2278_c0_g1_i6.p1 TRINITY_DN2278_c0_g1~~TRINITY_DN2278_c0_g1_i6.p1  ORF type:complete len:195 (+),score=53.30 TRINITY_DN2278_c0_g1_i6:118-702(+)
MLDQFQRDLKKNGVFGTVAFITGSIHDRLGKYLPSLIDFNPTKEDICDPEFIDQLWANREGQLVRELALKLQMDSPKLGRFEAWNRNLMLVSELAWVHMERVVAADFYASISACDDDATQAVLHQLWSLHCVSRLDRHRASLVESGLISMDSSRTIHTLVPELSRAVVGHSLDVVQAFGLPDEVINAPIAMQED